MSIVGPRAAPRLLLFVAMGAGCSAPAVAPGPSSRPPGDPGAPSASAVTVVSERRPSGPRRLALRNTRDHKIRVDSITLTATDGRSGTFELIPPAARLCPAVEQPDLEVFTLAPGATRVAKWRGRAYRLRPAAGSAPQDLDELCYQDFDLPHGDYFVGFGGGIDAAVFPTRDDELVIAADAPPEQIYPDGDGSFEFQRTASRLQEMRSREYLALAHVT